MPHLDGPAFAARLDGAARRLRAGDDRRPAEPPRQPRHATRPVAARRRSGCDGARRAAPGDAARRAVHLLRRRGGRHWAASIPTTGGRSRGTSRAGIGTLLQSVRAAFGLRRAEPALRADGVAMLCRGSGCPGVRASRWRPPARGRAERRRRAHPPECLAAAGAGPMPSGSAETLLAVGRSKATPPGPHRGRRRHVDRPAATLRSRRSTGLAAARARHVRSLERPTPILPRCPTYRWRCRAGSRRPSSPPSIEPESWWPPSTPSAHRRSRRPAGRRAAAGRSSTASRRPGARLTSTELSSPFRLDARRCLGRRRPRAVVGVPRRRSGGDRRGRSRPAAGRPPPRRPRLRPGRRVAASTASGPSTAPGATGSAHS